MSEEQISKPGVKTSEFWLTVLTSLAGASGALGSLYALVEKVSQSTSNLWAGIALVGISGFWFAATTADKYLKARTDLKTAALKE